MSAAQSVFLFLFIFSITVPAHAQDRLPTKEWNLLVFINGVNDLDEFGAMNINQMETVGSNQELNIIVQWASLAKTTVRRLYVTKDHDPKVVTSRVVQNIGQVDMGDYREFVKFVEWAAQKYPAKNYFVVIWNHGTGWHSALTKTLAMIRPLNISFDERTGNSFTTPQMGQAMREIAKIIGKKVDIYASDACLMGMIEIATEMADSINYYVGSQALEPGEGWSYGTFLQKWTARGPGTSAKALAQLASKDFAEAYSPGGYYGDMQVTMSVFDMAKIDPMLSAVRSIGSQLAALTTADLAQVRQGAAQSKYFFLRDYIDLKDFIDGVAKPHLSPQLLTEFGDAFREFVVANDQTEDARTFGVSIWLPYDAQWATFKSDYEDLEFNRQTGWSLFLERMNAAPLPPSPTPSQGFL